MADDEEANQLARQTIAALSQREVKLQVAQWRRERDEMRDLVTEFWTEAHTIFSTWWLTPGQPHEEARAAFVATALEDLPQGLMATLRYVCCPELGDADGVTQLLQTPQRVRALITASTPRSLVLSYPYTHS